MTVKAWMRPLRKAMERITEREIWQYNPDKRHPRIEGQFGADERVFGTQFNHLFICIDVSEPGGFGADYAEVIDYVDYYFKGIYRRFKRIHLNFWARESHLIKPFSLYKPCLMEKVEEFYDQVKAEVGQDEALGSALIEPFRSDQLWSKLKPDMLLILTRGSFVNDLDSLQLSKLRRFKNNLIWICFGDSEPLDLKTVLQLDPNGQKRIVEVINCEALSG
jgi:hypothetical protein